MPSGKSRPDAHAPSDRQPSQQRTVRPTSKSVGALRDVLGPVVEQAGFDLEEVTVTAAGRRSVVRVVVDSDDGIDLDAVAEVSRAISAALDADTAGSLVDGAYQLEVTSPGVDRPLTEPRHWRRALDRLVAVDIGGERVTGRVLSADTTGVVLGVDGASRVVGWPDLGPGRVQIEFSRDGGGESRATARTGED